MRTATWMAIPCLALALTAGPVHAFQQTLPPAEMEALRAKIKAELQAEMNQKQEAEAQPRKAETPTIKPSSQTPTAPAPAVAPVPIAPAQRYRIPIQYRRSAPGSVITYGGRSYLIGSDGTMTAYTAPTAQPPPAPTSSPVPQPTTTGNTNAPATSTSIESRARSLLSNPQVRADGVRALTGRLNAQGGSIDPQDVVNRLRGRVPVPDLGNLSERDRERLRNAASELKARLQNLDGK